MGVSLKQIFIVFIRFANALWRFSTHCAENLLSHCRRLIIFPKFEQIVVD